MFLSALFHSEEPESEWNFKKMLLLSLLLVDVTNDDSSISYLRCIGLNAGNYVKSKHYSHK